MKALKTSEKATISKIVESITIMGSKHYLEVHVEVKSLRQKRIRTRSKNVQN